LYGPRTYQVTSNLKDRVVCGFFSLTKQACPRSLAGPRA
jgi:hypothetical protein